MEISAWGRVWEEAKPRSLEEFELDSQGKWGTGGGGGGTWLAF